MSKSPDSAKTFVASSQSLKNGLAQIQQRWETFSQNKDGAYQHFKDDMHLHWESFNEHLHNYKKSLAALPRELRHRFKDHKTLMQLEKFQNEFYHAVDQWKHSPSYQKFHDHIDHLSHELSELETHPFVQKLLRGETVLSEKKQIQWGRKAGHAFFAVLFIWLFKFSNLPVNFLYGMTLSFISLCVGLETARHLSPKINTKVWKYFRHVMREEEKHKINSAMFYMFSMAFVYWVFPIDVCLIVFFFLGFGDTIAGIVGVKFGKHKLTKHASVEGFLAGFATCSFFSFLSAGFLVESPISGFGLLVFSLLAGAVGAVSEISFKKLDDNLVIPLLSAPFVWALMHVFQVL